MKKLMILGMLVVSMCFLTGCGGDEEVDGTAKQTIGFEKEAEEAVEENNEEAWELENSAKAVEEHME